MPCNLSFIRCFCFLNKSFFLTMDILIVKACHIFPPWVCFASNLSSQIKTQAIQKQFSVKYPSCFNNSFCVHKNMFVLRSKSHTAIQTKHIYVCLLARYKLNHDRNNFCQFSKVIYHWITIE